MESIERGARKCKVVSIRIKNSAVISKIFFYPLKKDTMTWPNWFNWGGAVKSPQHQVQMGAPNRHPSLASSSQQQDMNRSLTDRQKQLIIQILGKDDGDPLINRYINLRDVEALKRIEQRLMEELQSMKNDVDVPSFWKNHLQKSSQNLTKLQHLSEKLEVYRPIKNAHPVYKALGRLAKDVNIVVEADDSANTIMTKIIQTLHKKYPSDPSFMNSQVSRREPTIQLIQNIRKAKNAAAIRDKARSLLSKSPHYAKKEELKRQTQQQQKPKAASAAEEGFVMTRVKQIQTRNSAKSETARTKVHGKPPTPNKGPSVPYIPQVVRKAGQAALKRRGLIPQRAPHPLVPPLEGQRSGKKDTTAMDLLLFL